MKRQRTRFRFLCRPILIVATVTATLSFDAPVFPVKTVVKAMSFDPASTRPGGLFSARFSGTNLTDKGSTVKFSRPPMQARVGRVAQLVAFRTGISRLSLSIPRNPHNLCRRAGGYFQEHGCRRDL